MKNVKYTIYYHKESKCVWFDKKGSQDLVGLLQVHKTDLSYNEAMEECKKFALKHHYTF